MPLLPAFHGLLRECVCVFLCLVGCVVQAALREQEEKERQAAAAQKAKREREAKERLAAEEAERKARAAEKARAKVVPEVKRLSEKLEIYHETYQYREGHAKINIRNRCDQVVKYTVTWCPRGYKATPEGKTRFTIFPYETKTIGRFEPEGSGERNFNSSWSWRTSRPSQEQMISAQVPYLDRTLTVP